MSTQTEREISSVFMALVGVAESRGLTRLNTLCEPGQVVEIQIDDAWRAWVNPHKVEGEIPPRDEGEPDRMGGAVPAFTAWINYNGWLWGLVTPYGGVTGAHPDPNGANPERFERDCAAAIAKAAGGAR